MTPIEKVRTALKWYAEDDTDCASALRELEGMVIVPIEPTRDMCFSGTGFHRDCEKHGIYYTAGMDMSKSMYKAMIALYLPKDDE